ncbi:MAG: pilus assembly protein TadE [Rhodobacteraceae bacterium]|nr:MAG: pilus assembly protein TadE [Paracoccaceae bacterium]
MIRAITGPLRSFLGRFSRSENGSATIEFAITFPAMLFLMLSGVELGMITLQHSMLERALDMTVREIRLGTGTAPQHDQIKAMICARAGFIANCDTSLRLEMIQVDPRAWVDIPMDADCTDQSVEVTPVRSFVNGLENELMFLRACAKFTPVFPTSGLGKNINKDAAGQYSLVSTSAFVQEPR